MSTRSLSLGEKRPGRGFNHHLHLVLKLKEDESHTSTPIWAFVACYRQTLHFTFSIRL